MLAIGVDAAKNIAIAVVVAFAMLALLAASAIKNVTAKIITALIMIGFALGAWTQRASLQDCAQLARQQAAAGDTTSVTCTFFGTRVDVPRVNPP